MENRIQIIVADDNLTFLAALTSFLKSFDKYEVIAAFSSGASLLDSINDYDPDLILLYIEMPGLNGFEIASRLSSLGNELKLIAISMYQENIYMKRLMDSGFRGFVNKNNITGHLEQVMNQVMKGEVGFPEIR
jgi:DNA-binding NarL/FixJ family response regulator